jgi:hypothetical protein
MDSCRYKGELGLHCYHDAISERGYCLLHEKWKYKTETAVRDEVYRLVLKGITNFEGCILPSLDLSRKKIERTLSFARAKINGSIVMEDIVVGGDVIFSGAKLKEGVWGKNATVGGNLDFADAKIHGPVVFANANVKGNLVFRKAVRRYIAGTESPRNPWGTILFEGATIGGDVDFESFHSKGRVILSKSTVEGSVSFSDSLIEEPLDNSSEDGEAELKDKILISAGVSFEDARIQGPMYFRSAIIQGFLWCKSMILKEYADFDGMKIQELCYFEDAVIERYVHCLHITVKKFIMNNIRIKEFATFSEATFNDDAQFKLARIGDECYFDKAEFNGLAEFDGMQVRGRLNFSETKFNHISSFNRLNVRDVVSFKYAELCGSSFELAKIALITFEETIFHSMETQEEACRLAKLTQEKSGNYRLADYHYFREMEARRKQRSLPLRIIELPLQYVLWYGVHPFRLVWIWLVIVLMFALIYYIGKGLQSANSPLGYLYFSTTNSLLPGYRGLNPQPGIWQGIATIQAVLGTFIWTVFIVVLGRRFFR